MGGIFVDPFSLFPVADARYSFYMDKSMVEPVPLRLLVEFRS